MYSVNSELEDYLKSYVEIAKKSGVDLTPLLKNKKVHIYFKDLQSEMGKPGILGIAKGSRNDEEVHIEIDYNNWNEMDDLQKTTTMYHELSHDLLNAAHVESEAHLMHPTYLFKSTSELILATMDIFKQHKENTLVRFTEIETKPVWNRALPRLNDLKHNCNHKH